MKNCGDSHSKVQWETILILEGAKEFENVFKARPKKDTKRPQSDL